MPVMLVVMPVAPRREDAARAFAGEITGARGDEFNAFQAEAGNATRETWHLVQTPGGTQIVVWAEADDAEAGFEHMMSSTGFGEWFRGQIAEITGVDKTAADGEPPPEPEQLIDWTA
jgi:hypothetical protein